MHAKLKQIIRINKAQPMQNQVFFFWYKIRLLLMLLTATVPVRRAVHCHSIYSFFKSFNVWKSYRL